MTIIEESYKIADYKLQILAYEGHYLHRNTAVTSSIERWFRKGDYMIPTQQKRNQIPT
jgi:hypothetical protein